MKRFQIIELLFILSIVLLVSHIIGMLKYWYVIIIVSIIYYRLVHEYWSAPLNYPTEKNKDKSDLYNWRLWLWILILGVGVVGIVFSVASSNWKCFFLWLLLGVCCCYRLTKFFYKEDGLEVENEKKDIVKYANKEVVDADKREQMKNEFIVIIFCIGCVVFMMIWMVSKL